jgi:Co/Zn/Cd efflux system component
MDECCDEKGTELMALREKQATVLKIVLSINLIMFFVEATAGVVGRSTSLLGDSLDMLGDAVVYAFSLYVLHRSEAWRAGAAMMKGVIMVLFGLAVMGEAVAKAFSPVIPEASTMGLIGGVALAANTFCLLLLLRHRNDDINLRSTWRCSRNDIVSNLAVIGASLAVGVTRSKWPDIIVGGSIALLFLTSASATLKEARAAWAQARGRFSTVGMK